MAQYETQLNADFSDLLAYIDQQVTAGSVSASKEGEADFETDGVRCATRVYERFSFSGGNRLSLCVTLFGKGCDLHLCAIASGGSQAIFIKLNTIGEDAFLDKFVRMLEAYPSYR